MYKVVVVTGASSGIGLSHAIYLTSLGYTVLGTSRKAEKINLEALKEIYLRDHTKWKFLNKKKNQVKPVKSKIPKKIKTNLDTLLRKIKFYSMDVTDDISVKKAMSKIETDATKLNGRGIDVLINNAGLSYFHSAEFLSMEDWKNTFETNLFGMVRVVKAVLPKMRERRSGQIINTSTLGAFISIPFQAHYSASKVAIKTFTEGLRIELKEFNIKVSTILPSDINTNFNINMHGLSTDEGTTDKSNELKTMLENPPEPKSSPYYDAVKRTWKVIVQNLIVAPPPLTISKTVAKIIKAKKPKVNYKSGTFEQKFLTFLIRRVVTDEFVDWLLPKYFGM